MADNNNPDPIHVDEGTLHAWLDGALSVNEANDVRTHIAECAACAAAVAEARGLIAASTRILSALDDVPNDVVPQRRTVGGGAPSMSHSAWSARRYAPVAAVLVFAAVGALMLRHNSEGAYENVGEKPSTTAVVTEPQTNLHGPANIKPSSHPQVPHSFLRGGAEAHAKPTSRDDFASAAPRRSQPNERRARDSARTLDATTMEARVASVPAGMPAAAVSNSSDSVAITGRVTAAETGLPLPNTSVIIAGVSGGAMTDSAGFFSIANVPPGTHTVLARRMGYSAVRQEISTITSRPVSLALSLPTSLTAISMDVIVSAATSDSVGEFLKAPPTIVGTRQVSSEVSIESGRRVRRTVYAIGSGAQITLTERDPRSVSANEALRFSVPASALRSTQNAAVQAYSIEWVVPDGTMLILSGAFSPAELEAFKARLVR